MIDSVSLFLHSMLLCDKFYVGLLVSFVILTYFSISYFKLKNLIDGNKKISKARLEKQKDFFIETITHDFRIPTIAQLRGLNLLNNEILGSLNQEQKDLISEIENSCQNVLEMISMFSGAYKIEKHAYKLEYEKFKMSDLILSCFNTLSQKAKEKNVTFVYLSENKDTFIEADKSEIKKVVLNLLQGALNHSKKNGCVDVNITVEHNKLSLLLSGMELMYNANEKVDGIKYTTIGQTLGMYLCKKIIELHGGKLLIPRGTNTIKFSLPLNAHKSFV